MCLRCAVSPQEEGRRNYPQQGFCSVHCSMFNSSPGLCPLRPIATPPSFNLTIWPLRGKNLLNLRTTAYISLNLVLKFETSFCSMIFPFFCLLTQLTLKNKIIS